MLNKNGAYIIKFILLALPHLGFSITLPFTYAQQTGTIKKLPSIAHLFRSFKQNNEQQKTHFLRQPLVWATALSGALLLAYLALRQSSNNRLLDSPAPTADYLLTKLPQTPRTDPEAENLRKSTTELKAITASIPNAFEAGRIVEKSNLLSLLKPRLPNQ